MYKLLERLRNYVVVVLATVSLGFVTCESKIGAASTGDIYRNDVGIEIYIRKFLEAGRDAYLGLDYTIDEYRLINNSPIERETSISDYVGMVESIAEGDTLKVLIYMDIIFNDSDETKYPIIQSQKLLPDGHIYNIVKREDAGVPYRLFEYLDEVEIRKVIALIHEYGWEPENVVRYNKNAFDNYYAIKRKLNILLADKNFASTRIIRFEDMVEYLRNHNGYIGLGEIHDSSLDIRLQAELLEALGEAAIFIEDWTEKYQDVVKDFFNNNIPIRYFTENFTGREYSTITKPDFRVSWDFYSIIREMNKEKENVEVRLVESNYVSDRVVSLDDYWLRERIGLEKILKTKTGKSHKLLVMGLLHTLGEVYSSLDNYIAIAPPSVKNEDYLNYDVYDKDVDISHIKFFVFEDNGDFKVLDLR